MSALRSYRARTGAAVPLPFGRGVIDITPPDVTSTRMTIRVCIARARGTHACSPHPTAGSRYLPEVVDLGSRPDALVVVLARGDGR